MPPARIAAPVLLALTLAPTLPARGQAGPPAPVPIPASADPAPIPMPRIRFVEPGAARDVQPSPAVTEGPPADDFLIIPLRVHILSAADLPAVQCHLTDADVERIVGKVNRIWHKAGIHWAPGPILHEAAAEQERFRAAREAGARDALGLFKILAPAESKGTEGADVYYIHAFPVNGVFLGDRMAFVQETAQLRPVPGGIDEPLPRVTAHELGHALGLPHRQDRTNLLASGTTGTTLNRAEVDRARQRAARYPGAATVPDLRRRLDEAKARRDDIEAARLDALLGAIPTRPDPAPQP